MKTGEKMRKSLREVRAEMTTKMRERAERTMTRVLNGSYGNGTRCRC